MRHKSANNSMRVHEAPLGSILLISLIVLGVIALSSIFLSLILLNEIKSTRYSDNSIVGYYVGESGAEDALWRLKYAKAISDPSYFDKYQGNSLCAAEDGGSVNSEDGCLDASPATGSDPERSFDYALLSTAAADFIATDIERNSPVFTDIYDPTQEGQTGGTTGVNAIYVDWYLSSCIGNDGSAKLEITYAPIAIEDLTLDSPLTQVDVCGCAANQTADGEDDGLYRCGATDQHSASISLSSSSFYRVSFRSLDVPVKKLVMTTDTSVPSQIEIRVTGSYRESQSSVTLRGTWKDALSGIFNYVVFSEESLIKDTQGANSSAFDSLCGFCTGSVAPRACSSNADCDTTAGQVCSILNTAADSVDTSDTQLFCSEDTAAEDNTDAAQIIQTDKGACNALCNGYTYCGDGVVQGDEAIPIANGSGRGGPDDDGIEECDAGQFNSNTTPDACRTSCTRPVCGDGITDPSGNNALLGDGDDEQCDDGGTAPGDGCDATCKLEYTPLARNEIQITGYSGSALADFPILVHLTSANFSDWDKVQDDGGDIAFGNADRSVMYQHEIEKWAIGDAYMWVRLPQIPASAGTVYMYYNDAGIQITTTPASVWDNNFVMVQHLEEANSSTMDDSTSNGIDGTNGGQQFDSVSQIDGGSVTFDSAGVQRDINFGNSAAVDFDRTEPFTVEVWAKRYSSSGGGDAIAGKYTEGGGYCTGYSLGLQDASGSTLSFSLYDGDASALSASHSAVNDTSWHYFVGTYDGQFSNPGSITAYLDGTPGGGGAGSLSGDITQAGSLVLGTTSSCGSQDGFYGSVDELRISNTERSGSWVSAQYTSMTGQLFTIGETECSDDGLDFSVPNCTPPPPGP